MIFPGRKVGNCTDPRSNFSCGNSNTNWSLHRKSLLKLCQRFYSDPKVLRSQKGMIKVIKSIVTTLRTAKDPKDPTKPLYYGAGDFCSMQFIQLCSAFGLVPLFCITSAELGESKNLGPNKFIRASLNENMPAAEVSRVFEKLHSDLVAIWGCLITIAIIENILCELNRNYDKSKKKFKKKNPRHKGKVPTDVIIDDDYHCNSDKNDLIFWDEHRKSIQNIFLIRLNGNGASALRPVLVMKHSQFWEEGNNKCNIAMTNWCENEKGNKNKVKWNETGRNMTLETSLFMSEELKEILSIDI